MHLTDSELSEHYESEKLREFALYYCTLLSYEKVSNLISERCGSARLSDQRLFKLVQEEAARLTADQVCLIAESQIGEESVKAEKVAIYDEKSEEVIWLADGICVSEQKAKRDKEAKTGKRRTTTDMAMMQRKDGGYETLIVGQGVEKVSYYQAVVRLEYGEQAERLPVVAISDGARSIKHETKKVFGDEVSHILDWYHLEAKIYQLMTQIAMTKQIKVESSEIMIEALWHGETEKAISHLTGLAAKNAVKQQELIGYLEKNKGSIIDYQRRKEAGKIIGSGRMEKQNDVVVAHRQKRKGMSWSKSGSLSLALVTAYLN